MASTLEEMTLLDTKRESVPLEEIAADCGPVRAQKVYEPICADPRAEALTQFEKECGRLQERTIRAKKYESILCSLEDGLVRYSKDSRKRIDKKKEELLDKCGNYHKMFKKSASKYQIDEESREKLITGSVAGVEKKALGELREFLLIEFSGDSKAVDEYLEGTERIGYFTSKSATLDRIYLDHFISEQCLNSNQERILRDYVNSLNDHRGSYRNAKSKAWDWDAYSDTDSDERILFSVISLGIYPLCRCIGSFKRVNSARSKIAKDIKKMHYRTLDKLRDAEDGK